MRRVQGAASGLGGIRSRLRGFGVRGRDTWRWDCQRATSYTNIRCRLFMPIALGFSFNLPRASQSAISPGSVVPISRCQIGLLPQSAA